MSGPLTDAELAELRRLHEAATPGDEWTPHVATCCGLHYDHPGGGQHTNKNESWATGPIARSRLRAQFDADLIAAARNALPRLLDEVERLRAECGEWWRAVNTMHRGDETADEAEAERLRNAGWHDAYELMRGRGWANQPPCAVELLAQQVCTLEAELKRLREERIAEQGRGTHVCGECGAKLPGPGSAVKVCPACGCRFVSE